MELKLNKAPELGQSPLTFLALMQEALTSVNENFEFEFSIYKSGGQGITLSRDIFKLPSSPKLLSIINEIKSNLSPGQELAIHSNIYTSVDRYAIPLIDFSFKELSSNTDMLKKLQASQRAPFFLFASGRSFHGYLIQLISIDEWYRFLGKLLLINPPNSNYEKIDSRWVGHSLENGFSALRISFNSEFYLRLPAFVDFHH